jgi:geranylgeranyl pyrophosphate synthase
MFTKSNLEEQCYRILEEKGGQIADRARTILLKEKSLEGLQKPLIHISENWRDPATPSLVILSCEAVGGEPNETTYQAALSMTLMSLSFTVWDDLVDKTIHKGFIPTVVGRFGESAALMIGGLASAKAFSILSLMKTDERKRQIIAELVWNYCKTMAESEAANLGLRRRSDAKPEEKLRVIEMEAVSLETLSKIGAVLGDGSQDEVEHLGNYGRHLYTLLELKKDFKTSINLTLELAKKIKDRSLTYTLLWAKNHSPKMEEYLWLMTDTIKPIDIKNIVEAVLETKATENIIDLVKTLTLKAEKELAYIRKNKASTLLKFFLEAQSKTLVKNLSTLQF